MTSLDAFDTRPLYQRVYEILIQRVISGELSPGDRLDSAELALALGVSRTPVKDALARLESEGIVEVQARRGTAISVPTPEGVAELYEVIRMIALFVVDPAIERATADDIAHLEALLDEVEAEIDGGVVQDYAKYLERDRAFHSYVVELAGNSRMLEIYRVTGLQMRLAYTADSHRIHDVSVAASEHRMIIDAFRRRSASDLRAALVQHYHAPALLASFERAAGGEGTGSGEWPIGYVSSAG
jgi:DNA-binding GntR family transcriptional regulator